MQGRSLDVDKMLAHIKQLLLYVDITSSSVLSISHNIPSENSCRAKQWCRTDTATWTSAMRTLAVNHEFLVVTLVTKLVEDRVPFIKWQICSDKSYPNFVNLLPCLAWQHLLKLRCVIIYLAATFSIFTQPINAIDVNRVTLIDSIAIAFAYSP